MASVILDTLHSREDLLRLNKAQTAQLCAELRETLIQTVSQTGGHLSSNLGAVELTVALHRVFDTSRDRLVFDVGHQCYVHKLLTGRAAAFPTLRQFGGLGGFPNPAESIHDAAIAGHASNSVSVALGMARARTLRGEDYSVIAVLGDGALTGGLAYEGLCDAGASREPLIIVLNDNKMSIARNVGAIARHLTRMRMLPGYYRFKKAYRTFTAMAPGGKKLYSITHRIKQWMRNALLGANFFEEMGFTYLGPVDGHDVGRVSELLRVARDEARPVVLHVLTVKGKGYEPAERTPSLFHGVGGFNPDSGEVPQGKAGFSGQFGHALCQLAAEDHRVCAITAAMQTGTGLDDFAAQYPTRFFDVGIAEGHAVAMAAGLAAQGMRPVVAIYSTFLQRAYDMLIHDVAISRQHVVLAVDRAGLVGEDGQTHHGVFDVGFLRQIPGMQVLCPVTYAEQRQMLQQALTQMEGPVALRYPRGGEIPLLELPPVERPEITLIAYSATTAPAQEAAAQLRREGIAANLLRLTAIAPLDWASIDRAASCGVLLVAEDCVPVGSVGESIAARYAGTACRVVRCNTGDGFVPQGKVDQLFALLGLDASGLVRRAKEVLDDGKKAAGCPADRAGPDREPGKGAGRYHERTGVRRRTANG